MLHTTTFLARFLSILLVSGGGYLLFSACSAADMGLETCFEDSDCVGVCIDGACRVKCTGDSDCFIHGYVCQSRLRAEGGVVDICVEEDHKKTLCDTDAECRTELNDSDAKCSIDKRCFVPQLQYSLLIRDVTPERTSIDGSPGADIAAVYLTNTENEILAYATTLIARNAEGKKVESLIKGGAPRLNANDTCVEGAFDESTVKIGREGSLLVRFLDTKYSDYLEVPSTWNVNVIEWGDNCGVEGDIDQYEVLICTSSSYESIDFSRECVQIGIGKGYSSFEAKDRL